MEKMECRIQATTCHSLDALAHNVNDLGARLTAIEERVDSHEEDEQEDDSPLGSERWREPPAEPRPVSACQAGSRELTHRKVDRLRPNATRAREAHVSNRWM